MLHRLNVYFVAAVAIFLALSIWGCDRLKEEGQTPNQPPEVHFVNIPLDGSSFSYAPVVRWYGSDPDGLVDAFQYHDDSTDAAVAAYNAGDAALQAYINSLSPSSWISTYHSADTIYLRRAEDTTITQHIFMLRCVDNLGAFSPVKVRTFFRTNNPPNPPRVKWMLDVARSDSVRGYQPVYRIPDTLFWGDTLTSTYGGIGFLWQGTDPDSRALNIIPLTYSYLLRNVSTGLVVPHFLYDDSNHVIGADTGWSPWSGASQVTFSGANFFAFYHDLDLTSMDGDYEFLLRVRDDGLTEADSMATALFKAVSAVMPNPRAPNRGHNYERGLLVVDWTRHPTQGIDTTTYGMRNDEEITAFYNQVIPEGLAAAEQLRAQFRMMYPPEIADQLYPDPIPPTFDWYLDKDLNTANRRVPLDYLRHYKWVWIIMDNCPPSPPDQATFIVPRINALQEYMKVGGQVMMSGRGVLRTIGISGPSHQVNPTLIPDRFVRDYFNLQTVRGKNRYMSTEGNNITDFGGVTTTDPNLSNMEVDTALVHNLKFGPNNRFYCMPEIEYFGRSGASNGVDYSVTLYNYASCSVNDSFDVYNIDCAVTRSTPSMAWLKPAHGHTRILNVTRVYNRTRQVAGEFMRVDLDPTTAEWRIIVSTPVAYGAWQDSDTLEVDYTYVPIQPSNDQPVGTSYIHLESVYTYNRFTGNYSVGSYHRFRSAFFTFPFSFMKNDEFTGHAVSKVGALIAYQALYFNSARVTYFDFNAGGGGRPQP